MQLKYLVLVLSLCSVAAMAQEPRPIPEPPQQVTVCGQNSAANLAYVECGRARVAAGKAKKPLSPEAQTQCTAADALWATHLATLANCPQPAPESK